MVPFKNADKELFYVRNFWSDILFGSPTIIADYTGHFVLILVSSASHEACIEELTKIVCVSSIAQR